MKLAFILISISVLSFSCTTEPQGSFSDIPKDYNKLAEDRIQELSDGAIIFKCIKEYQSYDHIAIGDDLGRGRVSNHYILWNDKKGVFLFYEEEKGEKSLSWEYQIVDKKRLFPNEETYLLEGTWDNRFYLIEFVQYGPDKWRTMVMCNESPEIYVNNKYYYVLNKYN